MYRVQYKKDYQQLLIVFSIDIQFDIFLFKQDEQRRKINYQAKYKNL